MTSKIPKDGMQKAFYRYTLEEDGVVIPLLVECEFSRATSKEDDGDEFSIISATDKFGYDYINVVIEDDVAKSFWDDLCSGRIL